MLTLSGNVQVLGDATVSAGPPGTYLIHPGTTPVQIRSIGKQAEIVYVVVDASVLMGLHSIGEAPICHRSSTVTSLQPLINFITSLCSTPVNRASEIEALSTAALEVTRSLARIIGPSTATTLSLYERAIRIMQVDYVIPKLTVSAIAHQLDVSPRKLQQVFEENDTSVSRELRQVRTAAATELRRINPMITARELAAATGFGSVSTLRRALASSHDATPILGNVTEGNWPDGDTVMQRHTQDSLEQA